jgi:chemotaxis signal transduction protein
VKLVQYLPSRREHSNRGETGSIRLLLVRCGRYRLGVPARLVRAVVGARDVVPLGLPDLPGLLWRDGALIPAVELAPLIGVMEKSAIAVGHGVLIQSPEGAICFMVNEATDLVEVAPESIIPLPPLVIKAIAVTGLESATMVNGLLLIVDPVLLLGQKKAADLVAAAAKVGESGGSR